MARNTRGQAEALIKLVGEDQVSKLIEGVQRKIKEIGDETEGTAKRSAEGWATIATGVNSAIGVVSQLTGAVETYFAVSEQVASRAALAKSFKNVHGGASLAAVAIDRLNKATAGTVKSVELKRAANQAMTAGLTLTQTTKLFNLATKAAIDNGESIQEMVGVFAEAIAKGRQGTIRSLGATIHFGNAQIRAADAAGKLTKELTGSELVASRYADVMKEVGKKFKDVEINADDLIVKMQQQKTSWDELKDRAADNVIVLLDAAAAAGKYASGVKDMAAAEKDAINATGRQASGLITVEQALSGVLAKHARVAAATKAAAQATADAAQAEADAAAAIRQKVELLSRSRAEQVKVNVELAKTAEAMGKAEVAADAWVKAYKSAGDDLSTLWGDMEPAIRAVLRAEEDQRLALVENATQLAEMADQMGLTVLASKKWAQAVRAADGDTSLFNRTIGRWIASAKSAVEWAKRFDVAVSGGKPGDKDKKDPKKPPRGRRRKKKKTKSELRQEELVTGEANFIRKMINANNELQNAVATSQRAMDDLDADRSIEQLRRFREEAQRTGADLSGMAAAAFKWNKVMDEAGGAAAARGVIDMLGAISGNMQLHAGLMGAFEAAESIRSFVSQDYAAGVGHLAASVAYFAAAGTAGAGSAGGGGGGRPPAPTRPLSLGAPDQKSEKGGMSVTLNLSGATIIGGNERQVGADLARMVQQGLSRRGRDLDLEYVPG